MSPDVLTQLRSYATHLDDLAPSLEELTPAPVETQSRQPVQPGRRRWVAALLAAVVVVILIGGLALLANRTGSENVIIDQPIPTTTPTIPPTTSPPPPTTIPAALDGKIITLAYTEVPSFTGTVQYYEHDPVSGNPGWTATVEISHAGSLQYEAEVIKEEGDFALLGPGTIFFGDGTESWISEVDQAVPYSIGHFEPFRHLFFDGHEFLAPAWDDYCGATPTVLGVEPIVGRTTVHVSCSSQPDDYELWIDEESGVVLKMEGRLSMGDYSPRVSRDGLFEFTEIVFEPVTPPGRPVLPDFDGDFPPFHMVQINNLTEELWYLDDGTWRITTIDASKPELVGTYHLMAEGFSGGCETDRCWQAEGQLDRTFTFEAEAWQVPLQLVAENCTEVGQDVVVGRPTRHFACEDFALEYGGNWITRTYEPSSEYWYDADTGLLLKVTNSTWSSEVTLLELNPVFPVGIFQYEDRESVDQFQ